MLITDDRVWDVMAGHPDGALMSIADFTPFVDGLDHPEGVACGPDGEIYAGGEARPIYRVEPDGSHRQIGRRHLAKATMPTAGARLNDPTLG